MDSKGIGQALKMLRVLNDISLRNVSKATGIGYSHICCLETNKYSPSLETLNRLCGLYKCPMFLVMMMVEESDDEELLALKHKYLDKLR
jgi:transcriptional regulator with XRE-family HTH domain